MRQAKAKAQPAGQSAVQNLNDIATRFLLVKREIESLEKLQASYRSILENSALESQGKLDLPDYTASVVACERENFALKTARLIISESVLRPFINISQYNRLTVTEKKRVAALAPVA